MEKVRITFAVYPLGGPDHVVEIDVPAGFTKDDLHTIIKNTLVQFEQSAKDFYATRS